MCPMTGGSGFDEIAWLRANSPAWRLLRAENAPLVLSFLHRVFVADNVRSIPAAELASRLDDELFALNERTPGSFPKQARAYLDDWASPQSGWLRKYYPEGTDEPHFDATPAVEKALAVGAGARRARVRRHRVAAEHDLRVAAADRLRHRGRPASADRGADPAQAAAGRRDRAHRGGRPQHARLKRGARPLPAVLGDRAGAARRLPRGGGELQEAGQAAAGKDRGLARRQGRAARRRARQPRVDRGFRPGQVVPGVLRLPALPSAAGGAVRPARQRARAHRDRRERPPAAAHPLRLAGRRRAHPDDGKAAFRAAQEVPRRPGLVREPPGDRHPARHRVPRPPAPRIRKYPGDDGDRRRRRPPSGCRWSARCTPRSASPASTAPG